MDRIINVKVGGNHLSKDNKVAGVRGEANVTNLRITFDESWDKYSKKVTFWDALGNNPTKILLEDKKENFVPIPGEAMTEAGKLTFVIDGYLNGKKQRSLADELEVKDAPMDDNAAEPIDTTPDLATQLQKFIDDHKNDKNNPHNATAEQVGALPITGGTVNGSLEVVGRIIAHNNSSELDIVPVAVDGKSLGFQLQAKDKESNEVKFYIAVSENKISLVDHKEGKVYYIYGEHNKPTAEDVGAYSKEEADKKHSVALKYYGEVDTFEDLQNKLYLAENLVYKTRDTGMHYVRKGEGWEALGGEHKDIKADIQQINTALDLKANKSNVYTKTETDSKLDTKASATEVNSLRNDVKIGIPNQIADSLRPIDNRVSAIDEHYGEVEYNFLIHEDNANNPHNVTASQVGAYTKSEVDNRLNTKANADSVYTKTEMDGKLEAKADKSDIVGVYKFKGSVNTKDDLPRKQYVLEITDSAIDSDGDLVANYNEDGGSLVFYYEKEYSQYDDCVITIPCKEFTLKAGRYNAEGLFEDVWFSDNNQRGFDFYLGDGTKRLRFGYCYANNPQSYLDFEVEEDVKVNCITMVGEATNSHYSDVVMIYSICPFERKIENVGFDSEAGDVYNVRDTGMNYAYTGSVWDALGGISAEKVNTNVYRFCGSVSKYEDLPKIHKFIPNGNPTLDGVDAGTFDSENGTITLDGDLENEEGVINYLIGVEVEPITFSPGYYVLADKMYVSGFGLGKSGTAIKLEEENEVDCFEMEYGAGLTGGTHSFFIYEVTPSWIGEEIEEGVFALKSQPNVVPGSVYNVIATEMNYAWTGEKWDALGGRVNQALTAEILDNVFVLTSASESNELVAEIADNVFILK